MCVCLHVRVYACLFTCTCTVYMLLCACSFLHIFGFLFIAYPFPRFPPHMSPDESDDEESLPGDPTEPLPLPPLTPEPVVTPYPDPERRADAAKKRRYAQSCDYHKHTVYIRSVTMYVYMYVHIMCIYMFTSVLVHDWGFESCSRYVVQIFSLKFHCS